MIEIRNLSKSFDGVRVLNGVDLDIGAGEIHALVGANGSGKSTIVKSLSGYYDSVDSGSVTILGHARSLPLHQSELHTFGLRFVHQDLGLIEQMSLVDNVCLYSGYATGRARRIDTAESRRVAGAALRQLGLGAPADTLVRDLGPTERVIVAVARATVAGQAPGVLVLDEPTAAIPVDGISRIIDVIRTRRVAGWAVLYISHRLDEVLDLADRVTVLRDGEVVATRASGQLDAHELSEMIMGSAGRTRSAAGGERPLPSGEAGPGERRGLTLTSVRGSRLRGVSLTVGAGEIVGVTGPTGCGKSELGRLVIGADRPVEGTISIGGRTVHFTHPSDGLRAGVAYVPQDRVGLALIPKATVRENVSGLRLQRITRGIRISRTLERANVRRWVDAFGIVPRDPERTILTLSGGNQQKAVFARAAQAAASVLVLDDPTAGVDVGARVQIHGIIRQLADSGLPILLLSTELDELTELCDRVVVLRRGEVSAVLAAPVGHDELARAVFAGHGGELRTA